MSSPGLRSSLQVRVPDLISRRSRLQPQERDSGRGQEWWLLQVTPATLTPAGPCLGDQASVMPSGDPSPEDTGAGTAVVLSLMQSVFPQPVVISVPGRFPTGLGWGSSPGWGAGGNGWRTTDLSLPWSYVGTKTRSLEGLGFCLSPATQFRVASDTHPVGHVRGCQRHTGGSQGGLGGPRAADHPEGPGTSQHSWRRFQHPDLESPLCPLSAV